MYYYKRTIREELEPTQQQHMKTMMKAWSHPAVPTTQTIRMKSMTPNMFCIHGKNTPSTVPSLGVVWNKEIRRIREKQEKRNGSQPPTVIHPFPPPYVSLSNWIIKWTAIIEQQLLQLNDQQRHGIGPSLMSDDCWNSTRIIFAY